MISLHYEFLLDALAFNGGQKEYILAHVLQIVLGCFRNQSHCSKRAANSLFS